jgi:hypothetical protein
VKTQIKTIKDCEGDQLAHAAQCGATQETFFPFRLLQVRIPMNPVSSSFNVLLSISIYPLHIGGNMIRLKQNANKKM